MIKRKKVLVTIQEIKTVTCDKCGTTYDARDDITEIQEFMMWHNSAGYGSIFGDGNTVEIDLCQQCIKDVLGPYIRIKR